MVVAQILIVGMNRKTHDPKTANLQHPNTVKQDKFKARRYDVKNMIKNMIML